MLFRHLRYLQKAFFLPLQDLSRNACRARVLERRLLGRNTAENKTRIARNTSTIRRRSIVIVTNAMTVVTRVENSISQARSSTTTDSQTIDHSARNIAAARTTAHISIINAQAGITATNMTSATKIWTTLMPMTSFTFDGDVISSCQIHG